jgi:osmotically-inducible protein OsmY
VNATTLTNIDVNTTNGVVTLSGQVESAEIKSKADAIASSMPGVVRVNNNLQVNSAAGSVTH